MSVAYNKSAEPKPGVFFPPSGVSKESQFIFAALSGFRDVFAKIGGSKVSTVSVLSSAEESDYEDYEFKRPRPKRTHTVEIVISKKSRGKPLEYIE